MNTVTLPKKPPLLTDGKAMDVWIINTGTEEIKVLPTRFRVAPASIAWFAYQKLDENMSIEDEWRMTRTECIPEIGCGPMLPH